MRACWPQLQLRHQPMCTWIQSHAPALGTLPAVKAGLEMAPWLTRCCACACARACARYMTRTVLPLCGTEPPCVPRTVVEEVGNWWRSVCQRWADAVAGLPVLAAKHCTPCHGVGVCPTRLFYALPNSERNIGTPAICGSAFSTAALTTHAVTVPHAEESPKRGERCAWSAAGAGDASGGAGVQCRVHGGTALVGAVRESLGKPICAVVDAAACGLPCWLQPVVVHYWASSWQTK